MKTLVVDPDTLFARLLKAKLEAWGYEVTIEPNGEGAHARLLREPFRLVILERDLPGLDGAELCARIREFPRDRYTYVMFFTAAGGKEAIVAGLEAGADDVLFKPFDPVELQLRLQACVRLLDLEDRLHDSSGLDATGAINAAAFAEFFQVILAEVQRSGGHGALLRIDLHNHRSIVRQHGEAAGDAMLAQLATLLGRMTRASDLLGRVAQASFCLLVQHAAASDCQALIERIASRSLDVAVMVDGRRLHPELALSALDFPNGEMDAQTLLAELIGPAPGSALAERGAGEPAGE